MVAVVFFRYRLPVSFFVTVIETTLWSIVFLLLILLALPTIFIRKDCYECQFGFHIMAHERNHLLLGASDEIVVEGETLKQTEDRLIPIFLSNSKMCNDCLFLGRKMYCQAGFNYLKKKAKEEHSRTIS